MYHRATMSTRGRPEAVGNTTGPGLRNTVRAAGKLAAALGAVLAVSATCITSGGTTEIRESEFSVRPGALVSAEADNAEPPVSGFPQTAPWCSLPKTPASIEARHALNFRKNNPDRRHGICPSVFI